MSNIHARRRLAAAGASFTIAIALLAGCGGSLGGAGTASLGAQALRHLSPFERTVLKDKKVTVAELMESTQVYKECLDIHGISYQEGTPGSIAPSGIDTVVNVPPSAKDPNKYIAQMDAKGQACLNQVSTVEDVWVLQNQASQSQIDKAIAAFAGCVRRAGLPVPAGAGIDAAGNIAREFMQSKSDTGINSSSAEGREYRAVLACVASMSKVSEVALPGLAQALSALNTSGW